jgi:thymidylate synthase
MRNGEDFEAASVFSNSYWADLVRLLQAFWASGQDDRLNELLSKFENPIYRTYLQTRRTMRPRQDGGLAQTDITT